MQEEEEVVVECDWFLQLLLVDVSASASERQPMDLPEVPMKLAELEQETAPVEEEEAHLQQHPMMIQWEQQELGLDRALGEDRQEW
jgi:hypothetical protein